MIHGFIFTCWSEFVYSCVQMWTLVLCSFRKVYIKFHTHMKQWEKHYTFGYLCLIWEMGQQMILS